MRMHVFFGTCNRKYALFLTRMKIKNKRTEQNHVAFCKIVFVWVDSKIYTLYVYMSLILYILLLYILYLKFILIIIDNARKF